MLQYNIHITHGISDAGSIAETCKPICIIIGIRVLDVSFVLNDWVDMERKDTACQSKSQIISTFLKKTQENSCLLP